MNFPLPKCSSLYIPNPLYPHKLSLCNICSVTRSVTSSSAGHPRSSRANVKLVTRAPVRMSGIFRDPSFSNELLPLHYRSPLYRLDLGPTHPKATRSRLAEFPEWNATLFVLVSISAESELLSLGWELGEDVGESSAMISNKFSGFSVLSWHWFGTLVVVRVQGVFCFRDDKGPRGRLWSYGDVSVKGFWEICL